ncbi:MAG: hypothetical protein Q9203_005571 [Teloschistes exilis]
MPATKMPKAQATAGFEYRTPGRSLRNPARFPKSPTNGGLVVLAPFTTRPPRVAHYTDPNNPECQWLYGFEFTSCELQAPGLDYNRRQFSCLPSSLNTFDTFEGTPRNPRPGVYFTIVAGGPDAGSPATAEFWCFDSLMTKSDSEVWKSFRQKSLYSSEATQSTILRQAMAGDMKTARFDDPKSIVEDAISNNNSWVWEFLAAADFIKPGDRLNLEEADDQERKEKGLEPRPWSEIAKALKLQLYQVINDLEPHNGEDDIKQPGELKPRPIRDYQEYILLKLVVLKDKQWRKEQGLEPRSWEDVRDAFYESARLTLERLDGVHPPAVG